MTDPNDPLRALLAGWGEVDHGPGETIPAGDTEGIEVPPRSHVRALATDDGGVKGGVAGASEPLTPTAAGATGGTTTLAHGDVVHWTSHRISGLGQIVTVAHGFARIQTFLPCRTRSVTVPLTNVRPLHQLTSALSTFLRSNS